MDLMMIAATSLAAAALACVFAVNAGQQLLARYRERFLEQAQVNLSDLFLFVEPRVLYATNLAAIAILPILVWLLSGWWLAAIATAAVLAVLPRKAYRWLRQRRLETIQAQLPDTLMMLSGSIRAGLGFTPALESIVRDGRPPLTQELALVLREQHVGVRPMTRSSISPGGCRCPMHACSCRRFRSRVPSAETSARTWRPWRRHCAAAW
ncbi:type II secretion system F family protein [Lysobacter sp. GCM10012299]|uniref:type II secretion system F family protein n=1 Tax=Lysobacter sp. GCM10012299 TaxID=3317333 RepID=UPI003611F70B